MTAPFLWLVTGPSGAGKSLFCRSFAEYARASGWDVAGLLSPALFKNDIKTGILVEDLRTGVTRPLGSAVSRPPFDLPLGKWYLDTTTIDWGNRILKTCLPCDLLIVDELGLLELQQDAGWSSALTILSLPTYRLSLVVVRPELQETISARLPVAGTIHLETPLRVERDAQTWWERLRHGV